MQIAPLKIYANRAAAFTVAVFDVAGNPFVANEGDALRIKVGPEQDGAPLLDLVSGETTANGSGITITSLSPLTATLKIAQGDTANWSPGEYFVELDYVSATSPNPITFFQGKQLILSPSMGGEIGLT